MWFNSILEKDIFPDFLIRKGIRQSYNFSNLIARKEHHYEAPTKFYQIILGKHLKYSSGFWRDGVTSLDQAEKEMLDLTCERADLRDGQRILECGCGWGSLSLFMAYKFPNSKIVAVTNSKDQKTYIDESARQRGITNLEVVLSDINDFITTDRFDRIVSVEMFEYMKNYQALIRRLSFFLDDRGKMFVHTGDRSLICFNDHFKLDKHWSISGKHYNKTSEAWLARMDKNKSEIMRLFKETYGKDEAKKLWVYWRMFFMGCAELWGYKNGEEWFVSHYLFTKVN